jgi:hypothetical protein
MDSSLESDMTSNPAGDPATETGVTSPEALRPSQVLKMLIAAYPNAFSAGLAPRRHCR